VLLGFLRPTSGSARLFGLDAWKESARAKREVGYLPGDLRLYPAIDGREAVRIFGRARGLDLLPAAGALAERFDLDMAVRASQMSRGMRQKLGLILALAHDPRLLILDEPTAALDPIMQDRLKEHLRELAARGRTIFFSSHSLSEVEQLCDRVAILRRGRLVVDTTVEALRARARREVIIRWSPAAAGGAPLPEAPAGLEVVERTGDCWRCRWGGAVRPLIDWISARPASAVEDATISPPDLETLFREYYRE